RLLANETTSLCAKTAVEDFRQKFYHRKNEPPALIMLSTDGYANSFSTPQGFLKVGVDILTKLYKDNGLNHVKGQFKEWLQAATQTGSGDDITVGIMCYLPIVNKRPAPDIEFPLTEPAPTNVPSQPQPEHQHYPDSNAPIAGGSSLPGRAVDDKA